MKVAIVYSDGEVDTSDDYKGRSDLANVTNVADALASLGHEVIKVIADETVFQKLLELKESTDIVFNLA
jgi:hypothetical protein